MLLLDASHFEPSCRIASRVSLNGVYGVEGVECRVKRVGSEGCRVRRGDGGRQREGERERER
jgi:hypothetical protein